MMTSVQVRRSIDPRRGAKPVAFARGRSRCRQVACVQVGLGLKMLRPKFHATFLVTCVLVTLIVNINLVTCAKEKEKPEWAKKDIRDYSDADLERLFDQWEEADEPLEPDELPEHKRPPPPIDMSNFDPGNPEALLQMSKKGKTLMMFVSVSGNPSRHETEEVTGIWHQSLMNAHLVAERFVVSDDRVIFMFKDGSRAWEAKDYLVQQDRCKQVTIENKPYPGRGWSDSKDEL